MLPPRRQPGIQIGGDARSVTFGAGHAARCCGGSPAGQPDSLPLVRFVTCNRPRDLRLIDGVREEPPVAVEDHHSGPIAANPGAEIDPALFGAAGSHLSCRPEPFSALKATRIPS